VQSFLKHSRTILSKIIKEKGCRWEYYPTIGQDAGLQHVKPGAEMPVQDFDENLVTIIEKWDSVEFLRDNLASLHMQEYRKRVKELVEGTPKLKVLQEVSLEPGH
jgi:quinol monooxygenase YgiN